MSCWVISIIGVNLLYEVPIGIWVLNDSFEAQAASAACIAIRLNIVFSSYGVSLN